MMMAMLMISALSIKGQEQIEDSPLIFILNIRKKNYGLLVFYISLQMLSCT